MKQIPAESMPISSKLDTFIHTEETIEVGLAKDTCLKYIKILPLLTHTKELCVSSTYQSSALC